MSTLTPLYDPKNGPMRVIGLMSGSGSNLRKIIDYERILGVAYAARGGSPFHVVAIFTDVADTEKSAAVQIGLENAIPVFVNDISAFYKTRGKPRKDMAVREEFDAMNAKVLSSFDAFAAAFAGYMSIARAPLINAFLGVNVHPADLSLVDDQGRREYTGDHAVRDAIKAGEKELRSSTHLIEPEVDYGRILMISPSLRVTLPPDWNPADSKIVARVSDEHQGILKKCGDWVVFPRTLEFIARGEFSKDETGLLYFRGQPIPNGYRMLCEDDGI